jgi:uncharacterized protein
VFSQTPMQCPICKREFDPAQTVAMPFCSVRCRSIDLGRWLDEQYTLPLVPDPEEDETPVEDQPTVTD